jgi:hypothetical protein
MLNNRVESFAVLEPQEAYRVPVIILKKITFIIEEIISMSSAGIRVGSGTSYAFARNQNCI